MSLKNSSRLRKFCAEPLYLQILIHVKIFRESLFTIVITVLYIQNVS